MRSYVIPDFVLVNVPKVPDALVQDAHTSGETDELVAVAGIPAGVVRKDSVETVFLSNSYYKNSGIGVAVGAFAAQLSCRNIIIDNEIRHIIGLS